MLQNLITEAEIQKILTGDLFVELWASLTLGHKVILALGAVNALNVHVSS